ncbi:MAG TPA: hypothetical protein VK465_07060 [Fibrobacteria bacterium]|nr:hypothetical protein [Fibrobacteria bacterium]
MRMKVNPRFALLAGIDGAQTALAQRPAGKRQRAPRKAKTPEAVTQELTERYLDALGLPWFHMPAYVLRAAFGMARHSGAEIGAMARAAAIVRGLPDLLIWDGKGRAIAIELKTEAKASKLTAAQRMWRAAIGTHECRSFEAAKAVIDAWRAHGEAPK